MISVHREQITGRYERRVVIDDGRLRTLWGSHMSNKRIAEQLGCPVSAMNHRARKLGLVSRRLIWARQTGYGA